MEQNKHKLADNIDGNTDAMYYESIAYDNNQILYRVYCEERFYAVYKIDKESGLYKPEKMFMA